MAGPLSQTARAKSLANDFGPTRGPNAADSFIAHLYDDHPEFGGVELDTTSCPGYVAPTIDNDDFAADGDGGMSVVVELADATAAWTKVGRWVVLENAAVADEFWDYVQVDAVTVSAAGPFPEDLEITVLYADDSTDPA